MDLIDHERNGFLAEVEDSEALAHFAQQALDGSESRPALVAAGRSTAEANAYSAQGRLWRDFFEGYVEGGS
jgi:hypothetical protein